MQNREEDSNINKSIIFSKSAAGLQALQQI